MKIRQVAYENAPPYVRFFTKMKLCQAVPHENTPEKRERGNLYLAVKIITSFFPTMSPPGCNKEI